MPGPRMVGWVPPGRKQLCVPVLRLMLPAGKQMATDGTPASELSRCLSIMVGWLELWRTRDVWTQWRVGPRTSSWWQQLPTAG